MAIRTSTQVYLSNVTKLLLFVVATVVKFETVNVVSQPLFVIQILSACFCVLDLFFAVFNRTKFQLSYLAGGVVINILSIAVFHFIAVLYGAPLIDNVSETFHLSLLLTIFTTLPCCLVYGVQSFPWLDDEVLSSGPWQRSVYWSSVCSIVGAWFGAFPIPLDWDRPWQEWPVSCVLGACIGQAIGLVIGSMKTTKAKDYSKSKLG